MKRIPPSARTRESIRELLNHGLTESEDPKSELIRLATRLILEEALEGEALDLLGREYYQRGAGPSAGHRNGCRQRALKTAEGEVRYTVPQVRGIEGREL